MAGRPLISVIMNCLNGETYLREAIDSVFAQTFADWEIVFFDNASTDRSAEIAQSYGPRVCYFRNASTIKLGAARNAAMRLGRGDYIGFLDCDDVWLPRHLQALYETFVAQANVGLAYTDTLMVHESSENVVGRLSTQYQPAAGKAFYALIPDVYISPAMAMFPRQVLDRAGWFDESYDFVEESDLFLRIARDYEVRYVAEPLTIYRYHRNNFSRRFEAQQDEIARFHTELLRRYPDVRTALPTLELQWRFGQCARWLRWHLAQRRYWAALQAGWDVIKVSVSAPGYSAWRIKNFAVRRLGRGRQADWMN